MKMKATLFDADGLFTSLGREDENDRLKLNLKKQKRDISDKRKSVKELHVQDVATDAASVIAPVA